MFSVVIPVYNSENTIRNVLESVKKQTRVDLIDEVIIVNDGSIDQSERIIQAFIDNTPEIVFKYLKQENHGVSFSRNRGIRESASEWIALLDSDDIWFPNKLERQYDCIMKRPEILFLGCVYPFQVLFRKKYGGIHKLTPRQLCIRNMPVTPSVVFHRQTGMELGLFNEKMQYCEDINFYQKFLLKDSYYVLAEDLVKIGIQKKFHAASGLSSNLKKMSQGRDANVKELYQLGLISRFFCFSILFLNKLKYFRRVCLLKVFKILYFNERRIKNDFET